MTLLDRVKQSAAWDSRYNLPLVPMFNNPWLYMAYLDQVMRLQGESLPRDQILAHYQACEKAAKVPPGMGLFARWPHGSDQTSHDEIMGACYFHQDIARWVLRYLDAMGGVFNLNDEPDAGNPFRWNVYRFPWLRPYLCACAGFELNLVQQGIWAAHVMLSAYKDAKDDVGGRLRTWFMFEKMERFPLCQPAIWFWRKRMKKHGKTLKADLAVEPGLAWDKPGCTIHSELAPEEYRSP